MAQNFIQEGKRIKYTNGTGSTITSGSIVIIGALIGIALLDIADGDSGEVALDGVWELPKVTGTAMTQGDELFYNSGTNKVTKTATDKAIGCAFADQASGDTTVKVKLYGQGNGIPVAATVAALTDNTGGTGNGTLVAIPATTPADLAAQGVINGNVRDNLADLAAKVNEILTSVKGAGLMA